MSFALGSFLLVVVSLSLVFFCQLPSLQTQQAFPPGAKFIKIVRDKKRLPQSTTSHFVKENLLEQQCLFECSMLETCHGVNYYADKRLCTVFYGAERHGVVDLAEDKGSKYYDKCFKDSRVRIVNDDEIVTFPRISSTKQILYKFQ